MSTSAVPAVLDALVVMFTAALPTVQVIDGPFTTTPQGDYLTVGWAPGETSASTFVQEWRALRGNSLPPRKETFDVVCYVDSFGGDTDSASVKSRRDGAFALLAAVEDALRADLTLGGVVTPWVEFASGDLVQQQTEAGYAVGITFHITGYARI